MEEKILTTKKSGMPVLLLTILLYIAAIPLCVLGFSMSQAGGTGTVYGGIALSILSNLWLAFGWIFWCGLKVLKPQEALVLTLFGKYIGTLKGEGFYYVTPSVLPSTRRPGPGSSRAAMWTVGRTAQG